MDSLPSLAPDHPNLVVRKSQGDPKIRNTTVLGGYGLAADYVSFNNNIVNLERAVKERVFNVKTPGGFAPPPRPASDLIFNTTLEVFSMKLSAFLPRTAPLPHSDFSGLYTGRLKRVYEQAYESLCSFPFVVSDSYIKPFVKWEKLLVKKPIPDLVPRVISPRSPRYNVECGVFLKPLEKRFFKAIARVFGSNTVMKGLNAEMVGAEVARKWGCFVKPVAIGADASRFDQHVSRSALSWEHQQYLKCFFGKDRVRLQYILGLQLANKCKGYCPDGTISYVTDGGRMSGDMNTGLGNCLLMCAMMWTWLSTRGLSKFELLNNGDDCVMIVESSELALATSGFAEYFLNLGFTMITEDPVYEMEHISFCQTQPVFDGSRWIMVRDPRVCLSKDAISMKHLPGPNHVRNWMYAVGNSGLHLTGGIPVLQNAYRSMIRTSHGKKTRDKLEVGRGFQYMVDGLDRKFREPTAYARYSFWLAFGIEPSQQIALEQWYDRLHFNVLRGDNGPSINHSIFAV